MTNEHPQANLRRAAVLGHPISHSLSPVLHGAAYHSLGLSNWTYTAQEVTADGLPGFLRSLDESWAGLSLTMPLKHAAIPLLDDVDDLAWATGAANTIVVYPPTSEVPDRPRLVGLNTDVYGIIAAIREVLRHGPVGTAVVLGAGATAASALAALRELGCREPTVLCRPQDPHDLLDVAAERLKFSIRYGELTEAAALLPEADVAVATMPAHAADQIAASLRDAGGVLLDVVYHPRPTDLLAAWSALGGAIVSGERMLLHQAALQVEYFTKLVAPVAEMDAALGVALGDL